MPNSMPANSRNTHHFVRRAWGLAAPCWRSDERWLACGVLPIIVVLTLALVVLSVLYNDWNRSSYEAIQDKNVDALAPLLIRFGVLAGLFIIGAVFRRYLTQMLQMRWRLWLTR
jgi:vitamin B12/bleomycin/antimicrobial peptide transport system ATP-binding/permease protein